MIYLQKRTPMSHEFDESEMYPCDVCGEWFPREIMYELADGSIVCQYCLRDIEEAATGDNM